MSFIAPILLLFAAATFLAMLPTFTALWQRIRWGVAVLRDEMVLAAARRNHLRGRR